MTTVVVIEEIVVGRMSTGELSEIPLLSVIVLGGFLIAQRRAEAQRKVANALTAQREQARLLEELAVLKADFTATVAHELGSPPSGP